MRGLILHRLIQSDLQGVLAYYRREGGDDLAERFYAEFEHVLGLVTGNPGRSHRISQTMRPANFPKFPYHLIYREVGNKVRVLVLRPYRRDPEYGMERR